MVALPTDIDTTYPDSGDDPSVQLHQQYHDEIHQRLKGVVVQHGVTATAARPDSVDVVVWVGTVAPNNKVAGDYWKDVTNDIEKRWDGSVWQLQGHATYVPTGDITGLGPSGQFKEEAVGTGDGTQNRATFWRFLINSDNIAQVPGAHGATGSKVDGIQLEHHYGGAAMQGGRNSFEVNSFFDGDASAAGNGDRNYVALQGQWIGSTDDGGTSVANWHGAGFGGGSWAQLLGAAANWFDNLTAFEFNTLTAALGAGERVRFLSGVQVASENQKRGWQYDAGYALSGLSALHAGFKTGFLIGDMNGGKALAADSTLMQIINHAALTNAFDFSATNFTGFLIKTASGFSISAPAGNHAIDLGRQDGSGSAAGVNFHTGATPTAWDSRVAGTNGTGDGAFGGGTLQIFAANVVFQAQRSGQIPLVIAPAAGQSVALFQANMPSGTAAVAITAQGGLTPGNGGATGTGAAIWSGSGAPAAGLGGNGDYYLRSDTPGTANQRIYVKSAGTWTGVL